jgi:carbon storage regulator
MSHKRPGLELDEGCPKFPHASSREVFMLVLSRKLNEKIVIDGNIVVTIVKIDRNTVRVGIDAPREVSVMRSEIVSDGRETQPNTRPFQAADSVVIG